MEFESSHTIHSYAAIIRKQQTVVQHMVKFQYLDCIITENKVMALWNRNENNEGIDDEVFIQNLLSKNTINIVKKYISSRHSLVGTVLAY